MTTKITELTALAATPNSLDQFVVVDVSDTTQASSGTTKKVGAVYIVLADGNLALVTGGGTIALGGFTFTVPETGTAVTTVATQTLTNKTLTSPVINTPTLAVLDNALSIKDNGDNTKILQFQASGITTGTTRTLTVPDVNDTIVTLAAVQTLTNKTLTSPVINTPNLTVNDNSLAITDNVDPTKVLFFQASGITTGTTRTITVPDVSDTMVTLGATQTLTAKTLTAPTINLPNLTVADGSLSIVDDLDNTKVAKFQVSGVTTGNTRTLTWPDYNGTIATLAGTETLASKTLTSPVINTPAINTPTIATPSITGLLSSTGFFNWAGQSRVTSQFDKTTSTALANITGLSVTVAAGKTYTFVAELYVTASAAGGGKAAIAGTATATAIVYDVWVSGTGTVDYMGRATALGTGLGTENTGTTVHIRVVGTITVNAGGTLTTQFAQNTSSGTSSVLVGSTFVVDEIL